MRRVIAVAVIFAATALASAQSRTFKPVTDDVLKSPSPNDWIAWRGTPRSEGYSPLSQITKGNVSQLRLAWAWTMEPGIQQTTPLVYDGVMYLPNPGGILQALDAETGDLLWEYRTPVAEGTPRSPAITRGLALYDDKLFMTWDVDVVAIDARTGKEAWRTTIADRTKGFKMTAGPIAARGKIIAGLANCGRFVEEKCALVALDATTGKQVWRTPTVAVKGEPGDESWGTVDPIFRTGTDMWVSGSYDAELNLVYWSTAQAKPWTRFARGTDGDVLYSNTTLALDPDTGKIAWFRQTIPGETHDLDEVFESVLVDFSARKSLLKIGKMGILWEIDRTTGRILRATDYGQQNILIVDPKTGTVRYREDKIPKADVPIDICPASTGFKNWPAMAYSPETRALYVPHMTACAKASYRDVEKKPGGGGIGAGPTTYYLPASAEGKAGALTAIEVTSGKVLWQRREAGPFTASALTTAGGLVFAGTYDRHLYAFEAKTGAVLWHTRTGSSVQGFPVSYAVRGRQYIAVPVGSGGPFAEPNRIERLVPGIQRPRPGNSIAVFALPK